MPSTPAAPDVVLAHTGQLGPAERTEVRALLDDAFGAAFTDGDWEHALGGMHALVRADGRLVGHAALVQRRLLHAGRALSTGYVEGVAVHASARRQGHGHRLLAALEQLGRQAYDVLALGATDDGAALYAARGWLRWTGPTSALTPDGVVRTPGADGSVWVLPLAAPLDLAAGLTCDWRPHDLW